ncbi:MAG: efflux RND transporter periplasmic adaptor subunit [Ignavibacteria bacterium]|nr:efflux RND transporter periplasmic adaptor subunit [Ignavibacteria bacterium]
MVGTIQPNNDVNVLSETQGRVVQMFAKVGDFKSAGSVIATVDDELRQAALIGAQANYDKAVSDWNRYEPLHKEKAMTSLQLDGARLAVKMAESQLIIAKRQLKDTKITTPVSGIVATRFIDAGATVDNKSPIVNIVDISTLKVRMNVAEKDAFSLKAGDKVTITSEVYPGVNFVGNVMSIGAKGDEAHTYPVEISLNNSKEKPLKAGMFARVNFTTIARANSLVIPRSALVGSVKDAHVFVVDGNKKAHLKKVLIGSEAESNLEVLQGLTAGETIVVNGQNNLKDGTEVKVIK